MPKFFCFNNNFLTSKKSRITSSKLAKMVRKPRVAWGSKKYLTQGVKPSNSSYSEDYYKTTTEKATDGVSVTWQQLLYSIYTFADYQHPNNITIDGGVTLTVGNSIFLTEKTTLGPENLDTGTAFTLGTDYYVYICDPSNGNDEDPSDEVYLISANTTYPNGWNESNSRKIGGFHWGQVRRVTNELIPYNTSGALLGSGWITNVYQGIVPNSVWTLLFRPHCSPEGMVYLGNDLWGDIYKSSDDGNFGCASKKAKTPITGTEGFNWYGCIEKAMKSYKRLGDGAERMRAAFGSPPGADNNTNAYTSSKNTAKGATGAVVNAVSALNIRDMVGNTWDYTTQFYAMQTSLALKWVGAQASIKTGGILDGDCGDWYASVNTECRTMQMGAIYANKTSAGPRSFGPHRYCWQVHKDTGFWCVSKSANL